MFVFFLLLSHLSPLLQLVPHTDVSYVFTWPVQEFSKAFALVFFPVGSWSGFLDQNYGKCYHGHCQRLPCGDGEMMMRLKLQLHVFRDLVHCQCRFYFLLMFIYWQDKWL